MSKHSIMALEALVRVSPNLAKYHGQRGFEVERFIVDYTAWRDVAWKMLNPLKAVDLEPDQDAGESVYAARMRAERDQYREALGDLLSAVEEWKRRSELY